MEEEGINISELNMLLLQKIEELTLYIINIEKENNKLQKENKELSERLSEIDILKDDIQEIVTRKQKYTTFGKYGYIKNGNQEYTILS